MNIWIKFIISFKYIDSKIIILLLLFTSCKNNNVSGIYVNNIDLSKNTDTIKIYNNGKYERRIYDINSKTLIFQHKSSWKYDKSKIVFYEFLENYGGYTTKNKLDNYDKYLMVFFLPIERKNNETHLIFNQKKNHFFKKIKDL